MQKPLSVKSAEFVEPTQAKLYKYSATAAVPPPLPTQTAGPFQPLTLSLATKKAPSTP